MSPTRTGPIGQRELARTLITLIDAARAKNSSMHKDEARAALQTLLSNPEVNFRSSFIAHNLGAKRCRYLNSIGFWMLARWTIGGWSGPVKEKAGDDG